MLYNGDNVYLDRWLSFVIKKNVKVLELRLRFKGRGNMYYLPHSILGLSTLTSLKLDGLVLNNITFPISLPSLQLLNLINTKMDDEILNNLLLGCPFLHKLLLYCCPVLVQPQVSSFSLEFLELICHDGCEIFELEAMNLQTFVYNGRYHSSIVNIIYCGKIRNLSIMNFDMTEKYWVEDLIPRLGFLESLNLKYNSWKNIKIVNHHLKHLVLTMLLV